MTLELQNITKCVKGRLHIKPTSLILRRGQFNVLLGATGSGKTSLIKLMAGLDRVSSGSLLMDGEDVTETSPQKRNLSLVHQFFVNYPHMTVFENIASPLRLAGFSRSEITKLVAETAEILQLQDHLSRRPHELSGGQQQRTALARAMVKPSKVVFLDEPLVNLDYKLREELRAQLPEFFADRVVIYATSEPEEALMLGGQTMLMHDGSVVQFGSTADVYRHPHNLLAAQTFSHPPLNHHPVKKRGDNFHLGLISWEADKKTQSLVDGDYIMAIRPDRISPTANPQARLVLHGRIGVTEISGSESSAHFDVENRAWVSLSHGVHPYKVGEEHTFYLNPAECWFFAPEGTRVA